ncbi:hypothetical protein N9948_00615 [bacterium]|nr:hypothetical protein [bacterium]
MIKTFSDPRVADVLLGFYEHETDEYYKKEILKAMPNSSLRFLMTD